MDTLGWQALILLLLILGNGVFAMAEIALVSSRKGRLQKWADSGDGKARKALELIRSPGRFLATVQVGITLVGTLAGVYSGVALADRLAIALEKFPTIAPYSHTASLILVVLVVTYFQVVLGELLPKALALRHAETLARFAAQPMGLLSRAASPIVAILNASTEGLLRILGSKSSQDSSITEEEISGMLAQGTKSGVFAESQQDMMESVIEMGERRITSIMTARPDIVWLDVEATLNDVGAALSTAPHSWFPVFSGGFDDALGVVHSKAILAKLLAGEPVDLRQLTRPIPIIPDSIAVLKALETFRASGDTLAFVSDEYGSILGLVTLDDVLRNILGDLASPDSGEADSVKRADGSWLIDGIKPVEEVKDLLQLSSLPGEEENAYQTLGGFVMARLGRIPRVGDTFEAESRRYEVVDMDGHRVDKVLITEVAK